VYGIIPLAGPDFYHERLQCIKPLMEIEGRPLIEKVLSSRCWITSGELPPEKLVFILRDTEHTDEFRQYLKRVYPTSRRITVSSLTRGALLSAVAGCSLIDNFTEPLVVDLVDILYRFDTPVKVSALFAADPQLGGLLPVFDSDHPQYSYAHLDPDDPRRTMVRETAEKQVISRHASAGTYFFRDVGVFLAAMADNLRTPEKYAYKNNFFLCPVYNSVIANDWDVRIIRTQLELSVSLMVKS
jgi:hypothetical protein